MKFAEACEKYFGSQNLYDVLNIDKAASGKEVRKAYHKFSLSCHPDRVEESEKQISTEKFKILGKVYIILSDPEKRAIYDECGVWDEEDDDTISEDRDWLEYWRLLFKPVTLKDIEDYEKTYQGSEEELKDLMKAYEKWEGDMDKIYEFVPFLTLANEDRVRARLQEEIDAGRLPAYSVFTKEPQAKRDRRIRKLKKEEKEVEEFKKEKENDMGDLAQAILSRRQARTESLLDSLEKKYSKTNERKKKSGGRKSKA